MPVLQIFCRRSTPFKRRRGDHSLAPLSLRGVTENVYEIPPAFAQREPGGIGMHSCELAVHGGQESRSRAVGDQEVDTGLGFFPTGVDR
jgi:hypothetical protein